MPILNSYNGVPVYQLPAKQDACPVQAFPPLIGDAVREVSRIHGVPVELVVQAALASLSLAGQRSISVRCPNFPPTPCALYLLGVSNTSGGKSVLTERFRRPFKELEQKLAIDVSARMPDYRADTKIWEDDDRRLSKEYCNARQGTDELRQIRERRLLHEKARPLKPFVRQLSHTELSPQGLRDELAANGATGILSPEADRVLNGMTFSQPAALSGYWSGEDLSIGLAGVSHRVVNPRLTISVMLQYEKLKVYMENRGADAFSTGLLARILPVFPASFDWPGRQTEVVDVPEPALDLFNERVARILAQPAPAPHERMVLQLTEGAKHYWKLFREGVNNELICGPYSENIKSCFKKLAEQAARIAALLHYFQGHTGDVSQGAMKSAIMLCEWYAFEFIRIFTPYAPSQQHQAAEAAQKLLQWLQGATVEPWRYPKLTPGRYPERDLCNYSGIRRNPQVLESAIDVLHRQGHIAVQIGPKGGRVICYPASQAYPYSGLPLQPIVSPSGGTVAMVMQRPDIPLQSMPLGSRISKFNI